MSITSRISLARAVEDFMGGSLGYLVVFAGNRENWPATCLYRVFTLLFKDFMPSFGDSPLFAVNFTLLQPTRMGSSCGSSCNLHKLLCVGPFDSSNWKSQADAWD